MARIFGTDGVRGKANQELSPELAYKLGRAAAYTLKSANNSNYFVIGRDTRISGDMLESALIAGICSVGVNVYTVGVMPTPAIAFLTRNLKAAAGIVISASHNPVEDNGIKFFDSQGYKLSDTVEEKIEKVILHDLAEVPYSAGDKVGRVKIINDGKKLYKDFLKSIIETDLSGMKVVVDCANGAAFEVTPQLFEELGAEVISINDKPDGLNINKNCGSTHVEAVKEAVLKHKADIGIAHDGDADRVIAVDHLGNIVDGDKIIVICALELSRRGLLKNNSVVVTVMSNLGLKQAFEKRGILVEETKVGDRYVLERMLEKNSSLGGEQSGHIIFLDYNTTGDGILTALKLLEIINNSGKPLSELSLQMETLPQILENVKVKNKDGWQNNKEINAMISKYKKQLDSKGRILVRASGTEQLIRVMAEGNNINELKKVVNEIAEVIIQELN